MHPYLPLACLQYDTETNNWTPSPPLAQTKALRNNAKHTTLTLGNSLFSLIWPVVNEVPNFVLHNGRPGGAWAVLPCTSTYPFPRKGQLVVLGEIVAVVEENEEKEDLALITYYHTRGWGQEELKGAGDRRGASWGVHKGSLYCVGGNPASSRVEEWGPMGGESKGESRLQVARCGAALGQAAGLLWVAGGRNKKGQVEGRLEYFTPQTQAWSVLAQQPGIRTPTVEILELLTPIRLLDGVKL